MSFSRSVTALSRFSIGLLVLVGVCFSQPAIKLQRASGPPTTIVLVSGTGFPASTNIDIYFDTTDLALAMSDSAGSFSNISLEVPASAFFGTNWITAVARSNGAAAQRAFLVQTNWSMYGFSINHTGFNPYENMLNAGNVNTLAPQWIIHASHGPTFSPARVNGVIYFGGDKLYAVEGSTGLLKWSFVVPNFASSGTPTVANGVVFFGGGADDGIYAVNAGTGKLKWSFITSGGVLSSPLVVNGILYIGGPDGIVYALDANTGTLKWTFDAHRFVFSTPAFSNGVIYFGSDNFPFSTAGELFALDANTGALQWSFPVGAMEAAPVVRYGMVYAAELFGSLWALDAKTGQLKWSFLARPEGSVGPAVAYGLAYIGSTDGTFYALNAIDGTVKWRFSGPTIGVSSPATVANGVVYYGSHSNFRTPGLFALDANTGAFLWSYLTSGEAVFTAPTVANGVVYAASSPFFDVYKFGRVGGTLSSTSIKRPDPRALRPNFNLSISRQFAGQSSSGSTN